ncbi:hypothetical protein [Actinotalea sp.]|uniref:hypothetical protein n=1 Tax=Actinotalea sp. TaxID=1872145 RepID=UPI002B54D3A8|nr:hypothetical protein [Actinotalea sp.]HQY34609.1 hypothetical protein [Actinotalea sp.]HRA51236.1 hypothetical protein [Actinotalea sp.]
MTPSTRTSISVRDQLSLGWYLTRFGWAMQDYPSREYRAVRTELRASALATATEVGMPAALADLGHPYALADEYLGTLGRRHPRWGSGATAAVVVLGMLTYLLVAYSFGVLDGMLALGGGRAEISVLGGTWTFVASEAELTAGGPLLSAPGLLLALVLGGVAFAVGSRIWRLRTGR